MAEPQWKLAPGNAPGGNLRGRDPEWQVVQDLLRRAQQGLGGVLLVDGEWGMGKSFLLNQAQREAAAQGFALAAEPAGHWRIGPLRARLRQRAATAPVLISLDDLQWASPATLLALRMLPRELARCPMAWILARSDTRSRDGAELLFTLLEGDGARRITLAPLPDDAVAAMLADAFGAPPDQSLLARAADTSGNPSLLTELIHGLRDDNSVQVAEGCARLTSARIPWRIHLAARRGLDSLTRQTRQLLETASVLGRSFRLEDAAQMLGATPAALLPAIEEAMDAGIVVAGQYRFSFRRKLEWQAVAAAIPRPARKALHRQVGEMLLCRGGSATRAAGHLLEAACRGDPTSLVKLDQAAGAVLGTSPKSAARLAARALQLTCPGDRSELARLVAAAEALTAAGRLEPAGRLASGALARPLPAPAEARLRCALSSIQVMSGQALQACAQARLVLAQPDLPSGVRDHALIAALQAAAGLGDNDAGRRMAAEVLAAPEGHGDQAVAAALLAHALTSLDEGRIGEALDALRGAARHGSGTSPDARHCQPLLALAACLVDIRRFGEAGTVLRAADTKALRGIPSGAVPGILRARMHLASGRLSDAAAEGEAALATAEAVAAHGHASAARCVLSMIALRRGDVEAAADHIEGRPAAAPHFADVYARAETRLAEAYIAETRGGPDAVIGQVRELSSGLSRHRAMLIGEPATAAWIVRTALAAGDDAVAASVSGIAGALARDNPQVVALGAAAAHAAGLLHENAELLARATAQHHDRWARASAAEDLGAMLARRAEQRRAVAYLSTALDGYGQTGAAADVARVRRRLRRLGVRRRHWAPSAERAAAGWESLTNTERMTAELVAQGLSNRQAADRMYVSVHTIAFHLRQIFRKLSIGSRVELARVVMEQQGLTGGRGGKPQPREQN